MVDVVGQAKAREIFFTARRFDAEGALQAGLVNQVIAKVELDAYVLQVAEEIASNAPLTIASAKLVLGQIRNKHDTPGGEDIKASIRTWYESDEYDEGVRAFLEKRSAKVAGR